ncbi:hypothetical protein G6F46_004014 [Rhizopus delemar]|uniref:Uncharacterized protein n=2 Tax=Rhizopus TaxID=4842 RepID=A0A9P6Z279_9FUNG|nr:hypothetical protein G6F55_007045 [Rhizopus delemar]KAG1542645.1 hypothetical protein G6F51_007153 [Rhizopus arrhizus]KAG1500903.1 hypothetical protein G6F54_003402 [Rhizopus delemar]KAG1507544.1 hypothetical protein G6F52_011606 [Rhizopus delemar]KAG1514273.1 hypothetical protein G6F53_003800 [Rhizopus delemar]
MHGESASVDITSESIQNELREIEELLGPYDPVDIMNFDETEENDNTEESEQCVDIVECKKQEKPMKLFSWTKFLWAILIVNYIAEFE